MQPRSTHCIARVPVRVQSDMNPLNVVVRLFVNIFGITQPAPEAEARAGRMIALMLAGVLALLVVAGLVLRSVIAR